MKQKLLLALIVLCFSNAFAQTPESLLVKVQQNYTQEKIYLHYDKSFYVAGETIWFKAYLVEGFLPSASSTVLAVELLNDSGRLIQKKVLPVMGSAAVGEFSLDKALAQGNYTVKAYTIRLMNFGFESFYYHHLNIYNPAVTNAGNAKEMGQYILDFFPEGGNLIGNVENNVAFKCTDNYGRPKELEGKITDAQGKEIVSFKSTHNGMGSFEFIPRPGEKYIADCLINSKDKKIRALPEVLAEGVVLNINQEQNKTFLNLDATTVTNGNFIPEYILGVQENLVAFKIAVPHSKRLKAELPASQLPTGILQVTVFNKQNKPLAERLAFINSGDYLSGGSFKTDTLDLKSRARNSFSFNNEDTIPGTFSVSVTDADAENKPGDNIISRLLLTSDIKGIVYNPAYYFESNDFMHQQQLDLVMLTHGWRKYSWNEILSDRFPAMSFKDPQFITIAGQAYNASNGKPLANSDLMVISKTKDNQANYNMVSTDATGNFLMEGLTFEDTVRITFRNSGKKNVKVKTRILSPNIQGLFNSLRTPLPPLFPEAPTEKQKIKFKEYYAFNKLSRFDGILLDEVKITAKAKSEREKYEKKYVSGRMGNFANKTIDFLKEPTTSSQNIFSYLQSRVNGVRITGGPINYSVVYRNNMTLSGGATPMAIFLDEMVVHPDQIATMRISEIALINVYSSSPLVGAGGALAIYTKKGDDRNRIGGIDQQETIIEGFTPTKEFFSPDYSVNSEANVTSDERLTLYWNPYLITNAENKTISFSFYNSDKAKKFKVVLEGMREDGKLVHIEKLVE